MPDAKQLMRDRMRSLRRELGADWIAAASAQIRKTVEALPEFASARSVACYLALPHEVQTKELVERCWRDGKKVCVPAARGKGYVLAWLAQGGATKQGRFGIPEPARIRTALPGEVDLIVVPAVAFDAAGRRLGHGGGHYDRLLAACRGLKVGVAFEAQVVEDVPCGPRDVGVDLVVTERNVYPPRGVPRGRG